MEKPDPKRSEKIRQAFEHFAKMDPVVPQIKMVECKECGGEHPVDVLKDIKWAITRVKYRKARNAALGSKAPKRHT